MSRPLSTLGLAESCWTPSEVEPVSASLQCSTLEDLIAAVRRLRKAEEPPYAAQPLTPNEQECQNHFVRTYQRTTNGRYQVRLPIRPGLPDLTATRQAASRMLSTMERWFERDPALRVRYQDFLDEYLALGHMAPVEESAAARLDRRCYLTECSRERALMRRYESSSTAPHERQTTPP